MSISTKKLAFFISVMSDLDMSSSKEKMSFKFFIFQFNALARHIYTETKWRYLRMAWICRRPKKQNGGF